METSRFKWKHFLHDLAIIAVPVALQNLLTTTASMVDTMMLAPLGEHVVGSVGLCAQFASLLFSCYWGFVGGGMLFFAQYWGAKHDEGIDRSYGTTMFFMMIMGILFTVASLCFPQVVMQIYTDKETIQQIGAQYLSVVGLNYPLVILATGMSALLRSTERVNIPLYASIASVSTNIFLNWVFIYGHLGFPAMGVRGAALATVCGGVVNISCILILAKMQGYPYLFHFGSYFRWSNSWLREYLTKCFPILCNELLMGVAGMVINIVLGRQTEEVIAAVAVFRVLEGLVIGFFAGFSNAASILVGKNVGAGHLHTAYERAKRLVLSCGVTIFFICVTLFAFHTPILHAMSLRGESFAVCTQMLLIYCVVCVIRMCNWTQNDTYRSAGDAAYGTILEISFMYLVVLPTVLIANFVLHLPFIVVFLCIFIDEPIRFILMQRHMYSGKWMKPVTPQGKEALVKFMEERKALRKKAV